MIKRDPPLKINKFERNAQRARERVRELRIPSNIYIHVYIKIGREQIGLGFRNPPKNPPYKISLFGPTSQSISLSRSL